VTNEWDNTPWAGSEVKSLTLAPPNGVVRRTYPDIKAVTGPGVQAYARDYPLSSLGNDPQDRCARFLQAYKCGWFYKAESKISGDLATLPWTVSDGDIESDDPRETEIGRPDLDVPIGQLNPIEQFMRLMEKPNPKQTGRQLRQKTFIRRDMAGVAFWYLEAASANSPISAIYGISPTRLWPAYDKNKQLIGWVLDYNSPNPTPFETWEIVPFSNASAEDDDIFGVGVVEAVYAELPLTTLLTQHSADLLSTGGRLAGMLWPKDRALSEDEFTDAQRAWRNVVSDPASAKRLLLFPEPMEWSAGASTPAEIGIPELAALNMTNILTAFPIAPEILGMPQPSGLNASGETRRQLYDFYWSDTIGPRASSFDEIIQTNIISRYEALMGQTFRFESELPQLDDASSLLEKAGAFRSLVAIGFDPKDTIKAVGLDHIKWNKLPPQLDPNKPPEPLVAPGTQPALSASVTDDTRNTSQVSQGLVSKAIKSRETIAEGSTGRVQTFLTEQRERLAERIRDTFPAPRKGQNTKALRMEAVKAPDWWNKSEEDRLLRQALYGLYLDASRGSLQVVADALDRIIPNKAVERVLDDIAKYGGSRITDINDVTLKALTDQLSVGTERGYSIPQLIDGVPDENYAGVRNASLDNGVPAWGDARAETIARTETALSYNRAALDAYKEFRVSSVIAYDGDYDEECAARNGREFTLEEAMDIEDHPNGTLDWAPVVDKAWHQNDMLKAMVDLAGNMRPIIQANGVEMPLVVDVEPFTDAIKDQTLAIREIPAAQVTVQPTPVVFAERKAQGTQDVRIVDDITPPKTKKVIRGAPSKQYPIGPVEGVVEEK
jgi:phage portal protein BeeE